MRICGQSANLGDGKFSSRLGSEAEVNLRLKNSYQQTERTFMLTWANKFGNNKLKDARNRARGASDEMRRL